MPYPASDLVIDPVLIRKYDVSGPRYTSYPTADRFVEAFGESQLRQWLARRNIGGISQPLSVYVHLPFCTARYIKYLEAELALLGGMLGSDRRLSQLHWGGGTPTFLAREEMGALMAAIDSRFERPADAECAIEVDPRAAGPGTLEFLAGLGFNHVQMPTQDEDATRTVVVEARASGFRSVRFDLEYGLPLQTLDGFQHTLDRVIGLEPDRIALHSYAPLPFAELKLQLLTLAIGRLARAGYLYLGMEVFARPDDELAIAQAQGRLQRNVQGYSTQSGDLVGLGCSAIGRIGPTCYQNQKRLDDYYAALDQGVLPVARGVELTKDDLLRAAVIQALICQFRVSIEAVELAHLIDFRRYFAGELADLRRLARDGLVEITPEWISVTPKGRLLVRVICMVFDGYVRQAHERAACSRVL